MTENTTNCCRKCNPSKHGRYQAGMGGCFDDKCPCHTEKQEFSGATFEQHHEHGEKKEHACFEELDNAIRKGRARHECATCGKDVSLAWFLYQMAIFNLYD